MAYCTKFSDQECTEDNCCMRDKIKGSLLNPISSKRISEKEYKKYFPDNRVIKKEKNVIEINDDFELQC